MRLGYNTSGLQNHRLEDGLRLLADHGYEAVALTPDVCHVDPYRVRSKDVEELAGLLQRLGMQPVIETGARFLLDPAHKHEPTLMTQDGDAVTRRVEFYRLAAGIGRDLGAEVLSFWTGIDHNPSADSPKRMLAGILRAVEAVTVCGLQAALEPEPGMALQTVGEFEALCAQLWPGARGADEAPLGLCLDVGHLLAVWEGEPKEVIARAAPWLRQVHLEDMARGVHEHLEPGQGDMDFASVFAALHQSGYEGPVCWELSRSSHTAPTAIARCAEVFRGFVR
jgi:L-ribulose-5-phosphate 3-epimerase